MQNPQKIGDIERLANLMVKINQAKDLPQGQGAGSSPKFSFEARKDAWEKTGKGEPVDVSRPAIF